jgi:hypothetical protein
MISKRHGWVLSPLGAHRANSRICSILLMMILAGAIHFDRWIFPEPGEVYELEVNH